MDNFMQFMQTNFLHVLPILVAGAFALAVILERTRALFFVYPLRNEARFFLQIQDFILEGKVGEAVAFCSQYPKKPVAQVVKKTLLRAHQPESLIENGMDLAVEDAVKKIQRRTSFLAMVANVATLLGLLGTIAGLVHSFDAVANVDAQLKAALLAKGISQAMYATMLGLSVAIPAMVAFSFLMNRTNHLISDVETGAIKTFDFIKQRYFEAERTRVKPHPKFSSSEGSGKTSVA